MKKILFIIIGIFSFIGSVYANNEPLELVSIVNRCSVIKDNTITIPVNVVSINDGNLTTLIDEYTLGYVYNLDEDVLVKIIDVEGISSIKLDTEHNSDGMSLIRYHIDEDIESLKNNLVFSFTLQVEFRNEIPSTYSVLGNEVIIGNDDLCQYINGYEVKESVRVDYRDLASVDHTEMIEDIVTGCIIGILVIVIIILTVLLIRKKK